MRSDIAPGRIFPDYELPDHTNTPRKLSELQGDDPLILTLLLAAIIARKNTSNTWRSPRFTRRSPSRTRRSQPSLPTTTTRSRNSAHRSARSGLFSPTLERIVQKDLDIQEYTDPENNPMIPHTLVLKPGLVIHSIYNGYWFWGRPSIADLWRDLRAASSEIRPDWDLTTPGLREKWDAGDRSSFHGANE